MARPPPNDITAERAVLSAAVIEPECLAVLEPILQPDDFYAPRHRAIWTAILAVHGRAIPVDVVTVRSELRDKGQLGSVVEPAYLGEVIDGTPSTSHVEGHAQIVREKSVRRQIQRRLRELHEAAFEDASLDELAAVTDDIGRVATGGLDARVQSYADVAREVFLGLTSKDSASTSRMHTGIAAIDVGLGGLWFGDTTVVGAKSGFGKSTLVNAIYAAAKEVGANPLIVSTEDRITRYGERMLVADADISADHFRDRSLDREEWAALSSAVKAAEADTDPSFYSAIGESVEKVAANIRGRCAVEGHRVVILDFLQRLRSEQRFGNKHELLSHAMQVVTEAAKRHGVAMVVFSQLVKSVGKYDKPTLQHLKETGDIEVFSDQILLGYRSEEKDIDEHGAEQSFERRWMVVAKAKGSRVDQEYELPWEEKTASIPRRKSEAA